ncbi:unnamed protein product [Caenorhabditis sp. 36 PRJEB53466]|nr:unnamed protein product [Caenorhabditis sp. 36 PRJEB53466]
MAADVSSFPPLTSSVVMADNPLLMNERQPTATEILSEESSTARERETSDNGEWTVVKNKHPVFLNEVVVVVLSDENKKKKDEKTSSIVEVAECWSDVEIDEEEERRKEKKRQQRQKQRAAKVARKNEERERNAEIAQSSAEQAVNQDETSSSSSEVKPENPDLLQPGYVESTYSSTQKEEAGNEKEEEEPVLNSSGKRKYSDNDIIKEEEEEEEDDDDPSEPKEKMFIDSREHAKIMFRILWFDNKKKLEKLYIDEETRESLQGLIDMVRVMKDRVDMAGRMIVYRVGRPKISDHIEENIVKVARNLIDVTRHMMNSDMAMAKTVCEFVGKTTKSLTYMNYVFSILTLPEDFFPKLKADDPRIIAYKHITTLTQLHMKRVEKIYERIGDFYDFKIEKVKKGHRRR